MRYCPEAKASTPPDTQHLFQARERPRGWWLPNFQAHADAGTVRPHACCVTLSTHSLAYSLSTPNVGILYRAHLMLYAVPWAKCEIRLMMDVTQSLRTCTLLSRRVNEPWVFTDLCSTAPLPRSRSSIFRLLTTKRKVQRAEIRRSS